MELKQTGGRLKAHDAGNSLVRAEGLVRYFDVSAPWLNRVLEGRRRQFVKAVDGVSFQIQAGGTIALVGESGCGKSTVAKMVVGLDRPTRGTVEFGGVRLTGAISKKNRSRIRRRIQMIFQDPYASLNPRHRVKDIIAEPIRFHGLYSDERQILARVKALLTQVGLSIRDGYKYPHEFSGGQRQRISIARALAGKPEFIVCDEPTSALDVSVQAQILNLMKDLQRDLGLTYLFISHDLAVVDFMADMIGVMYLGRLCEWSDPRSLFNNPRHPYTRMLLEAIPDVEMKGPKRHARGGEVPNPIDPPPGCAFHPRCSVADDRCRQERPEMIACEGGAVACFGVSERNKSSA